MLGRIRENINIYTTEAICRSFVLPILDYSDTVWNRFGSVNADKLEKLYRGLGSSDKALDYLDYVTLETRRESHTLKIVLKCLCNRCPQFLRTILITTRMCCPES